MNAQRNVMHNLPGPTVTVDCLWVLILSKIAVEPCLETTQELLPINLMMCLHTPQQLWLPQKEGLVFVADNPNCEGGDQIRWPFSLCRAGCKLIARMGSFKHYVSQRVQLEQNFRWIYSETSQLGPPMRLYQNEVLILRLSYFWGSFVCKSITWDWLSSVWS